MLLFFVNGYCFDCYYSTVVLYQCTVQDLAILFQDIDLDLMVAHAKYGL